MQSSNLVSTLLVAHFKLLAALSPQIEEMEHMSHVPYASVVGSVMCAMVYIKHDITHVVIVPSRKKSIDR